MQANGRPGGRRAVAVLGATGCVGSGVCAAFSARGYDVLAIARNHPPRATGRWFVPLDIAAVPAGEIARVLAGNGVDVVVNATGGWLADHEANEYHHVRLVERLLEGLALMPAPTRIVQVGSIHEYGPVRPGLAIDESVEPRPETSYARTKLASSEAVLSATRAEQAHGVVLRAVNVCGPRVAPASFLGLVVGKLLEMTPGQRLSLSIRDAERDYLDVRDLAEAVLRAAEAPVVGRVINIGRGEPVRLRQLLSLLVAAAGFPPDVIVEQGDQVRSRGSDWTLADIRLAERTLGWRPGISLPDSMRDMWEAAVH